MYGENTKIQSYPNKFEIRFLIGILPVVRALATTFMFMQCGEQEGLKMKRSEMLSPTCSELSNVTERN